MIRVVVKDISGKLVYFRSYSAYQMWAIGNPTHEILWSWYIDGGSNPYPVRNPLA